MWRVNLLDSTHTALNLVPRKKVAGISVRTTEIGGTDELEKRLFSTIRVVPREDIE